VQIRTRIGEVECSTAGDDVEAVRPTSFRRCRRDSISRNARHKKRAALGRLNIQLLTALREIFMIQRYSVAKCVVVVGAQAVLEPHATNAVNSLAAH
jgi:hypothetical protein